MDPSWLRLEERPRARPVLSHWMTRNAAAPPWAEQEPAARSVTKGMLQPALRMHIEATRSGPMPHNGDEPARSKTLAQTKTRDLLSGLGTTSWKRLATLHNGVPSGDFRFGPLARGLYVSPDLDNNEFATRAGPNEISGVSSARVARRTVHCQARFAWTFGSINCWDSPWLH